MKEPCSRGVYGSAGLSLGDKHSYLYKGERWGRRPSTMTGRTEGMSDTAGSGNENDILRNQKERKHVSLTRRLV